MVLKSNDWDDSGCLCPATINGQCWFLLTMEMIFL